MSISKDILYVGVNDHKVDLFEGQYKVPNGMCYNSYLILDEKVAVMDTVDQNFTHEWLDNLENALAGRKPDYLIVQHMEPDHSANIDSFLKTGNGWTPRKVEVGLDNNRMIRILKGAKPGDIVMTAPPVKEEKDEEKDRDRKERKKGDAGGSGST